ncbi:tyrosine-protein phosphatase [Puia sp.]|jgi:tyrosine-protein phosphatase YwqE|uniref:tyrosine-protein phosphatase n=1 Tax=Puia sp. TaxID=2045100 RepID=UPI002F40B927
MFSFFKRKPASSGPALEGLRCDMHSHLIPGIDDGAQDMDQSIGLIRGLVALGYKKIITTPHINADGFPNTPAIIREGQAAVVAELKKQGVAVEFHAAAEYLLDDGFSRALSNGESFLTLKDNLILVEFSFVVPAMNIKDILFQLQLKGYQPVLAHPERYLYFGANKGWYDQLRDAGCLFQLNLLSFRGHYGKEALQLADYLVKKGYVDLLGTDLHRAQHLEGLHSARIEQKVAALLDTGKILNPGL